MGDDNYTGITEGKELYDMEVLNDHLKTGWVWLKTVEKHVDSDTVKGILHRTTIVYIVGLKGSTKPAAAASSTEESKPQQTSTGTLTDAIINALGVLYGDDVHILKDGKEVRMDFQYGDEGKERWHKVNDVFEALKFEWISDKKESRWELKTQ